MSLRRASLSVEPSFAICVDCACTECVSMMAVAMASEFRDLRRQGQPKIWKISDEIVRARYISKPILFRTDFPQSRSSV
jgi:hypothetical protein